MKEDDRRWLAATYQRLASRERMSFQRTGKFIYRLTAEWYEDQAARYAGTDPIPDANLRPGGQA